MQPGGSERGLLVEEHRPALDVLLLDVRLGADNGPALLEDLRARGPAPPAVFTTENRLRRLRTGGKVGSRGRPLLVRPPGRQARAPCSWRWSCCC